MGCQVTGLVVGPDGAALVERKLVFTRTGPQISGLGAVAVVAAPVEAETDSAGEIDVTLLPGGYEVATSGSATAPGLRSTLIVPDQAEAVFGELLVQVPELTNAILSQVLAARDVVLGLASSVPIRALAAAHAAEAGDAGQLLVFDTGGTVALTLPAQADEAWSAGAVFSVAQVGAGSVTIEGAGGVTVVSVVAAPEVPEGGVATCLRVAEDKWLVVGDVA